MKVLNDLAAFVGAFLVILALLGLSAIGVGAWLHLIILIAR